MTSAAWKPKLIPAAALLVCYFVVPGIVGWFMGANDAIFGEFTFSLIVQAGLGIALARVLYGLRQLLRGELASWLAGYSQSLEKTLELSEKVSTAAVVVFIFSILWPLAGEILTSGPLMTLIKIAVLVYAGWMGYKIWKLAEPFMAAVHTAAPPGASEAAPSDPAAPPAPMERRCAKCGQRIADSMNSCAFCGQPIAGN